MSMVLPSLGDDRVVVVLKERDVLSVPSHGQFGPFVIHRRIERRSEALIGWTITHVATGHSIWTVAHYAQALQVAKWLDHARIIPDDHAGCLAWAAAMNADRVAYTRFVAELSAIAPRYITT